MEHKTYTYKGFTIRKTEATTQRPQSKIAKLFEIEGLKSAGSLPFITSIREAKEFINKSLSPRDSLIENLSDEEVHSEISY